MEEQVGVWPDERTQVAGSSTGEGNSGHWPVSFIAWQTKAQYVRGVNINSALGSDQAQKVELISERSAQIRRRSSSLRGRHSRCDLFH